MRFDMTNSKLVLSKFINNLSYAVVAQGVSLLSNAFMSVVVGKFLGVVEFAYWQLFVFYTTYVGLFHFGLTDGVYLRYGGTEWDKVNKREIGAQLKWMNIFHVLIFCLTCLISICICVDVRRAWVLIFAGLYLIIANQMYYLSFIFQAVNETKIHSISIIISKVVFIFLALGFSFSGGNDFKVYCISFLSAHSVGTIYLMLKGKEIICARMISFRDICGELWINIKAGISLTISNVASNLILGIGRVFVDLYGNIRDFGIISLAISLTSFVLNFLAQVGMVMFPVLRRYKDEALIEIYTYLRDLLSYFLCVLYVFFIPFIALLRIWLPQYEESFRYMAILFPICLFDGKMQMLYNTYFKVLRREKALMNINILSVICSAFFCIITTEQIRNKYAVAFAMLLAIFFRSVLSSVYLARTMQVKYERNIVVESILSFIFISSNIYLGETSTFFVNFVGITVYCFFNRKKIAMDLDGVNGVMSTS